MLLKSISTLGALSLAALIVVPWWSPARGPGKTTPQELDRSYVRTPAKKRPRASAINFNKAYKLPWSSLHSLGGRIDAARQSGDPVTMGHLANELNVGEKVSGKKAPLSSSHLFGEAVRQAKLRRDPAELHAVYKLADQMQADKGVIAALQKDIEKAKLIARKKAAQAIDPKLPAPLKTYPVKIENYIDEPISIFMNGKYQITVRPEENNFLIIVNQQPPVVLYGYSTEYYWGPRTIYETLETYRWALAPPK